MLESQPGLGCCSLQRWSRPVDTDVGRVGFPGGLAASLWLARCWGWTSRLAVRITYGSTEYSVRTPYCIHRCRLCWPFNPFNLDTAASGNIDRSPGSTDTGGKSEGIVGEAWPCSASPFSLKRAPPSPASHRHDTHAPSPPSSPRASTPDARPSAADPEAARDR